jgi:hypothetical protein
MYFMLLPFLGVRVDERRTGTVRARRLGVALLRVHCVLQLLARPRADSSPVEDCIGNRAVEPLNVEAATDKRLGV